MNDLTAALGRGSNWRLGDAIFQNAPHTGVGLSERIFAWLFTGLVYPQIWEDPDVDMAAMRLEEGQSIVTIASGGCNILAYLTRKPARIDAVDLNPAHIALNRLKLAAIGALPAHGDLYRFFSGEGGRQNAIAYDRFMAPRLDRATRDYWERRGLDGRRRIEAFNGNFYRKGLLGRFISAGHLVARLHGVDPAAIMEARTLRDQRHFYEQQLRPLFERPLIRWATCSKASLFGLGIPPAQYASLGLSGEGSMARVLAARLEKLACEFPLRQNYFAWQAFARRYPKPGEGALPAYLEPQHHALLRQTVERVDIRHANLVELLASKPEASVDRFVLLDAQDWMRNDQLDALWSEITRTAAPGARVIFRTADRPSLLPGRLNPALLARWRYDAEESAAHTANDRSAIYGGFHLYVLDGE